MTYLDKAEATREYYRKQGEEREKLRILTLLQMLEDHHNGSAWSPKYIISLVNRNATRTPEDQLAHSRSEQR